LELSRDVLFLPTYLPYFLVVKWHLWISALSSPSCHTRPYVSG